MLGEIGSFDEIDVRAAPGTSRPSAGRRGCVGARHAVTVRTGAEQAQQESKDVKADFSS